MDGISFGLEVCRDHYLKRLAHSAESGNVQIQLVPSAGMSIEESSVACVRDGLVFNVDGDDPHVEVKLRSAAGVQHPVISADSGGGKIRIHGPQRIAWPGLVRSDVAQRLHMSQGVLSGTQRIAAPPLPPRT